MDIFIEEIKKYVNKTENLIIGLRDGKDVRIIGDSFKNYSITFFYKYLQMYL